MTWPPTSTVWPAAPDNLPVSAILPSLAATSPRNAGIPEPSTISPFLINRSYAIGAPPLSRCARSSVVADYSVGTPQITPKSARGGMRNTGIPVKARLAANLARTRGGKEIRTKHLILLVCSFQKQKITEGNRLIERVPRHGQLEVL